MDVNSGFFNPTMLLNPTADPLDYAQGDFNGDGRVDVLLIQSGSILTFLANGTGRPSSVSTQITQEANVISTGDFNGDGILDLANLAGNGILSTFMGNGDGTFRAAITRSSTAEEIDVGDFNNDGLDDIILKATDRVDVLLSRGNGTYDSTTIATGDDYATAAIGDLNGDGDLDVLIGSANNDFAYVYSGNGAGNFTEQTASIMNITAPRNFTLADLNNDGLSDLVYEEDSTNIAYAFNLGNFSFDNPVYLSDVAFEIDILDVNHDGYLDIIASEGGGLNSLINNNGQSFTSMTLDSAPTSKQGGFMDANDDGVWDRIRAHSGGGVGIAFGLSKSVSTVSNWGLNTSEDRERLLGSLDNALETINQNQTKLSIFSNQLDLVRETNETIIESYEDARTNLQAVDYAQDLALITAEQIKQQAQLAVLAQANTQRQIALSLLSSLRK